MAAIFAFKCSCCGKVHEGSPSIAFKAPDQYASLSEGQKEKLGKISADFCTITDEEGTDSFIRTILEIPIHGIDEPFLWGVWVSVSEKSFSRYWDTFDNPIEGDGFFGWLCNTPSVYPSDSPRPADVHVRAGKQRPKVILHRGEGETDPMVLDQVNGISITRAQQLAEGVLHEAT